MSEPLTLKIQVEGGVAAAEQVERVESSISKTDESSKKAEKSLGMFGRGLTGLRGAFSYALGVGGFAGLAFGIGDAVKNATAFQDASKQLSAALKGIGARVGPVTARMNEFADALSVHGGFAPVDTLTGLTALVRVTGSATRAQTAMTLATNVARGAHVSLERAVRSVTMAEQGRTTGLSRLGINIIPVTAAMDKLTAATRTATPAQQRAATAADMHATAVEALRQMTARYAGATKTYSATAAGATGNLSHALDILGEKVGLMVTPYIVKAANAMSGLVTGFEDGTGAGGKLHAILDIVGGDLKSVWQWASQNKTMLAEVGVVVLAGVAAWNAYLVISKIITLVGTLKTVFSALRAGTLAETFAQDGLNAAFLANPIGAVIVVLGALAAAFVVAYNKVGWFRQGVNDVWTWLKKNWPLVLGILTGPVGLAVEYIVTHWGKVKSVFADVAGGVKSIVTDMVNAVITAIDWVIRAVDKIHVHIPGWIPGIGGRSIGFNIAQIAPMGGGGAGHGGTTYHGASQGHRVAFAQGGYVFGHGKRDNVPAYLKPGEYVATDDMVEDAGGRGAMDSWRNGGGAPGMDYDRLVGALTAAMQGTAVVMDGQQVGALLTRQGANAKALR